jgi:hypothetical protein
MPRYRYGDPSLEANRHRLQGDISILGGQFQEEFNRWWEAKGLPPVSELPVELFDVASDGFNDFLRRQNEYQRAHPPQVVTRRCESCNGWVVEGQTCQACWKAAHNPACERCGKPVDKEWHTPVPVMLVRATQSGSALRRVWRTRSPALVQAL